MKGSNIGQADRRKLEMFHGTSSIASINHRDASNPSGAWKKKPTVITPPAAGTRRPPNGNKNPYVYTNNLGQVASRSGNPNKSQTLLAKYKSDSSLADFRAPKRPRLDAGTNGAPSSFSMSISRSSASESEIQEVESPSACKVHIRPKSLPNDTETMIIGSSSDDLGEPVARAPARSSPDPLLIIAQKHAFETLPKKKSSLTLSGKGKRRAKDNSEQVVSGSEEEDDIDEFTSSSYMERPSHVKKSPAIPIGIVSRHRERFEGTSAPAAIRRPIILDRGVPSIDLTSGARIVSRMKKKDEAPLFRQGGTGTFDSVGTSSSNFINPSRQKEGIYELPLEAWCFGHHFFQHDSNKPLTLRYTRATNQLTVVHGRPPPSSYQFRVDRDVDQATITNDDAAPLRNNVVIQFQTTGGTEWKNYERKLEGFKGGGGRSSGRLVFLFSTSKDRGFTPTLYQTFVTDIRKPIHAVEIVRPSGAKAIWDTAYQAAEMFDLTQTRKAQRDRSEVTAVEPPVSTRSPTPCSSFSFNSRTIRPAPKPPSSDAGTSVPRRSTRQSMAQTMKLSPPPPPPSEPDELILMYPPTGTGALSIMRSDLRRLGPEEYLNDTLIEFGLKLWLNDLRERDPVLADQIHVFSSFFYKKLNNRKNPEEGYQSVRKWTSKVDLFSKKYIIVPINENIHWYLAIIYEPRHTLEPPLPPTSSPSARTTRKRKKEHEQAQAEGETIVQVDAVPAGVEPEQSSSTAQTSDKEASADTPNVIATCASTPSMTEDEQMGAVSISAFDQSCSIAPASRSVSVTSSKGGVRAPSLPDLQWPSSDVMDVDVDATAFDSDINPRSTEITEVRGPSVPKSGIPVSRFYRSEPEKGKEKVVNQPVDIPDSEDGGDDQQQEAEVDGMLTVKQSQAADVPLQTYIFTLDSLGTRHPQAIRVLKQYLEREAKDKRNFDEVRDAVGKQVQVPVQPNTWDCGVYLLHFVKVFMRATEEFSEHILSTRGTIQSVERRKRWQDHEVPHFRDCLISRINELSEAWKAEKTAREEGAKKRKSEEVEVLSSEGEVDIVEDVSEVKVTSAPKQKRHANRLRG
ncbi:hypothetical protein PAXRUDRAFT_828393 [Paxillus rubicundulus Ve08.2h10]|uniref:Ubiquitin-like protease family profile domain-containing protein n=1 Tax=Paxillus rubicundulus Ve08.2h10 TaxID=930991 RepID=A0A0D0E1D1_9AGAM|nr:hypothetical protein PAXRUDRAFT_828393 [Paxillus rubicundulus Ve08.2h10]